METLESVENIENCGYPVKRYLSAAELSKDTAMKPSFLNFIDGGKNTIDEIVQDRTDRSKRELAMFLDDHEEFVTEKRDPNTNIISRSNGKTYNIPNTHICEFFNHLDRCRQTKLSLHYGERQAKMSGIMIDLDRYQTSKQSQFTSVHFQRLTYLIADLIGRTLNFTNDMVNFKVFVIQKTKVKAVTKTIEDLTDDVEANEKYSGVTLYKDGIHILIPEIMVTREYKRYLLGELRKKKILSKVFNSIENIVPAEEMLDMASAYVPVMFFGCCKPGNIAYELNYVYEMSLDTMTNCLMTSLLNTEEILSGTIDIDGKASNINLTYELSLSFKDNEDTLFTSWLSPGMYLHKPHLSAEIQLLNEVSTDAIADPDDVLNSQDSISTLTLHDPEASFLQKILGLIDIKYATDYLLWIQVIFAIANTSQNYKLLAEWFSRRKPTAYDQAALDRIWDDAIHGKSEGEPRTKRSLIFWAKESNPQRYNEIMSKAYFRLLSKYAYEYEGKLRHAMVAEILHSMLSEKFVVDIGVGAKGPAYCWYEFVLPEQKHKKGEVYKWRQEMLAPDVVHLYICRQLPKIYDQTLRDIKSRKDEAESEALSKYFAKVESAFKNSKGSLFDEGYRSGIVKSANYWFRHRGFTDELDKDPDIFGVGNGVLILGENPRLIQGFHEHKVSMFTETNYMPYDPENYYIKELERIVHEIFPDDDVYEYIWYFHCTGLEGRLVNALMLFIAGGGGNGKTFILELIRKSVGQYGNKLSMGLLTEKREKPGANNSSFAKLKGLRLGTFSETDDDGVPVINAGRFKEMVSPEEQTARKVYGRDEETFEMITTLVVAFNKDFKFKTNDHAMWRRVRYTKGKVKFCDDPDPNNPYEKKKDARIINEYPNDPRFREACLSILVEYNRRLRVKYGHNLDNIPIPTIDADTQEYRNSQDTINRFITRMAVKRPKNDISYSMNDLSNAYIGWYNSNYEPLNHSAEDIQKKFIDSALGKFLERRPNGSYCLVGHRIRDSEGDPTRVGESLLSFTTSKKKIKPDEDESSKSKDESDPFFEFDENSDSKQEENMPIINLLPSRNEEPENNIL